FQGHAFFDHVLDTIANDRDHVAVLDHIGFIAKPAMAWNNHRAAFLLLGRDSYIEDKIQRIDEAVDAAAILQVDDGIVCGGEDVPGEHDIGTTEEHNAVAVCVRRLRMKHLDGFTVEEQLLSVSKEG